MAREIYIVHYAKKGKVLRKETVKEVVFEFKDFVVAYGVLVKIVGRREADNIMLLLSHSEMSLEEKMDYLKDLVWCIRHEQVAVTVNPYLN